MIRCLPYNSAHTEDSIKSRILYTLEKWRLAEDRLHCVVSDSAANMKKLFEELNWIACFLHILALGSKALNIRAEWCETPSQESEETDNQT